MKNSSTSTNDSLINHQDLHHQNPLNYQQGQYRTIYIILLFLVLIFSTVGNLFVIIVQCSMKKRFKKKLINLLVCHLAVSDLLMVLASIPNDLLSKNDKHFLIGPIGCKIMYPLATYAITIGTYTMVAIAYERWKVVTTKLHDFSSTRKKFGVFLFIHIVSLAAVIPYILVRQYSRGLQEHDERCSEDWGIRSRRAYTIALFLIQYGIPVPMMLLFYGRAWMVVKESNDRLIYSLQKDEKTVGTAIRSSFLPMSMPSLFEDSDVGTFSDVDSECIQTDLSSTSSADGCPQQHTRQQAHVETKTLFLKVPLRSSFDARLKRKQTTCSNTSLTSTSITTNRKSRTEQNLQSKPRSVSESQYLPGDDVNRFLRKGMSHSSSYSGLFSKFSHRDSKQEIHGQQWKVKWKAPGQNHVSLWKKAKGLHGNYLSVYIDPTHAQGRALQQRFLQTVRLLKTFSLIAMIFVIFLLPNQILWLWIDFKAGENYDPIIADVTYLLTYTNCVFNPMIYGGLNKNIRVTFKQVFSKRRK